MPLPRPSREQRPDAVLDVNPVYAQPVIDRVPKNRLPDEPMDPGTAYQIVHDELLLDGNARTNLATFVTTWMEPQGLDLMAECADKNMIDKDEYPQTAELERRCVRSATSGTRPPIRSGARRSDRARPACSAGSRSSGAGRDAPARRRSRTW